MALTRHTSWLIGAGLPSNLVYAARRPHIREELVKDLYHAVGVRGLQEQRVDHDDIAELGASGT